MQDLYEKKTIKPTEGYEKISKNEVLKLEHSILQSCQFYLN